MLYILNELISGSCTDYTLGDVNHDLTINVLDIVNLVNYILGSNMPSECEFYASDLNGDGILNVLDIVQLVNQILGVE
jgi:hypothetical protein